MNSRNPIAFFSHYAREDAKLSLSRQMTAETGYDIWDIPGVKGLFIGDGFIGVATAEDHPSQGSLIPTELKRADYKGVPIIVQYHGYSYHLAGSLDHPDDARYDAYFLEKGYAGARGGGGSGSPQGGTQIVCGKEYGTAGGVFIDKQNKQYITCSWHVVKEAKDGAVNKGTGNRNAPESAGKIADVGKNGCKCGGGSQGIDSSKIVDGSGYSQIGYYGIGAPVNFDYALAYPAIFGRSINDIPYTGRRPLDHNFYQRGGGGSKGGGRSRGGTFWLDDTANPLTVKGLEEVLGLGKPKGFRRAVMNEKLSYRGVRSNTTKTMPVTGLNYTDRGGICGTCTDMVVTYPCPLPGDSGASFWGSDGYLVCVVTDGSNSKGGNNCTAYNCSLIHVPECFGINIKGGVDVVGQQPLPPGKTVTGMPISAEMIEAQKQRLTAAYKNSYVGQTIAVA